MYTAKAIVRPPQPSMIIIVLAHQVLNLNYLVSIVLNLGHLWNLDSSTRIGIHFEAQLISYLKIIGC